MMPVPHVNDMFNLSFNTSFESYSGNFSKLKLKKVKQI